jgi:hypothetical protein
MMVLFGIISKCYNIFQSISENTYTFSDVVLTFDDIYSIIVADRVI